MPEQYQTETRTDGAGNSYNVRIPATSLQATSPIQIAKPTTDTTNHAGIIANTSDYLQQQSDAAQAKVDTLNSQNSDTTNQNSTASQILSLMGQENNKAADTATANDTAGVTKLNAQLADLNAQAKNLNLAAQAVPIQTQQNNANTGATDAGVAPQNAGALRNNALQALSLSQQANIAQGNLTAATAAATQAINLKYAPIEAQLATLQEQYTLNKDYLTTLNAKAATALQASITKQQNDLAAQKVTAQNNATNQTTWANNAYQAGQSDISAKISQLDPNSPTFKDDLATLQSQVKLTADIQYKQAQTQALGGASGSVPGAGTGAINVAQIAGINDTSISLSQAITNVGMENIIKGILKNEGGTPQGTNNPGNIKFANQPGATQGKAAPDGGYYANFDTAERGQQAISNQIQVYANAGLSFQDAINKYTNTYPDASVPGTTKSANIDSTTPGYNNIAVPRTGGLTQAAIDQAALSYALTGQLPTGARASTGASLLQSTAIKARAAQLNTSGNVQANKAQLNSLSGSLSKQQEYLDTTQRAFNTANDTLNALTKWMTDNGINASQYPDINKFNNLLKSKGIDPGAAGGYAAQIATLRAEYSQVLARGGVRSVSTDQEASNLIPDGLSPAQLQTVADRIKVDGQNVVTDAQNQVDKINGQINGIVGGVPGITTPSDGSSFSVGGFNINVPQK